MAEPTGVLSFRGLLLRIAERAGMAYYGSDGQGKAIVPVDPYNLDRCKRIVNDGFRLFDSSPPVRGWHWKERTASIRLTATQGGMATAGASTTLTDDTQDADSNYIRTEANDYFNGWRLTIGAGTGVGEQAIITDYVGATRTFTFSAGLSGGSTPDDTTTYRVEKINVMPDDFDGQVDGRVTYGPSANHATEIHIVDESMVRSFRADFISTGYTQHVAFIPYTPAAGTLGTRKWEMLTDHAPSVDDTLLIPYNSHFNAMDCETGIATSNSTSTTLIDTTYRAEADDYFEDWVLTIISGTGLGQTATITSYDEGDQEFAFSGLSGGSTPDSTSVYYVEPAANLHPAGFRFDDHILAACYAEAEKQIEELNEGAVELFYKVYRSEAHKIDSLTRPRTLRSRNHLHRHRTWNNVTTDNDM